jgi:hypothetical protein
MEKPRYMHRNPVTRGLVMEPDQWRWSSYRFYAYDEPGPVLVNEKQPLEVAWSLENKAGLGGRRLPTLANNARVGQPQLDLIPGERAAQPPSSWDFSVTFQPSPLLGSTVTKSPGSGPPVIGSSVGTRVPVSFGVSYSFPVKTGGC